MVILPLPIDREQATQCAHWHAWQQLPEPLDHCMSRYGWELLPRFFSQIHLPAQPIQFQRLLSTESFQRSKLFLLIARSFDFGGQLARPSGNKGGFSSLPTRCATR
jgi:hypothetical protein